MRFGRTASIAAAVALIGAGAVPAVADAAPERLEYVNLGDSYSAGSGVLPLAAGAPPNCMQSADNFAHIVARTHDLHLTDVSCGAAATEDFFSAQSAAVKPQLDALDDEVDLVTFSIGGNDENLFADTVMNCVIAGVTTGMRGSPCEERHAAEAVATVRGTVYPNLVKAMRAVREKASNARVAALNYPWIAPDENRPCQGMPIAPGDGEFTHRVQTELNDAIARAAEATGVTLIDVAAASVGHDACKPAGVRWVEPLLSTVQPVPVHPNALGEREMARVAAQTLGL